LLPAVSVLLGERYYGAVNGSHPSFGGRRPAVGGHVSIRQPNHLQPLQPINGRLGQQGYWRRVALLVDGRVGDDAGRRRVGVHLLQAVEHHALLSDLRHKAAQVGREVDGDGQIGDEQGQVADGHRARLNRLPGQQHDQGHGDVTHALASGKGQRHEGALAHTGPPSRLAEGVEVAQHAALRVGHLDRLHAAQHFAQEAGDAAAGHTGGPVVEQEAPPGNAVDEEDSHQRQRGHQGDPRVDTGHDDDGEDEEDRLANLLRQPGGEVAEVAHVALQAVDGVAGLDGRAAGLRRMLSMKLTRMSTLLTLRTSQPPHS